MWGIPVPHRPTNALPRLASSLIVGYSVVKKNRATHMLAKPPCGPLSLNVPFVAVDLFRVIVASKGKANQ